MMKKLGTIAEDGTKAEPDSAANSKKSSFKRPGRHVFNKQTTEELLDELDNETLQDAPALIRLESLNNM